MNAAPLGCMNSVRDASENGIEIERASASATSLALLPADALEAQVERARADFSESVRVARERGVRVLHGAALRWKPRLAWAALGCVVLAGAIVLHRRAARTRAYDVWLAPPRHGLLFRAARALLTSAAQLLVRRVIRHWLASQAPADAAAGELSAAGHSGASE